MDTNSKPYVPDSVPVWEVAKWLGVLWLLVIATVGVCWLVYPSGAIRLWSRYTGGNTGPFSARQAPPNGRPRLQVDEKADLKAYLEHQRELLGSYGWIDKSAGIVRIPIEQAMQRIVESAAAPKRGAQ